MTLTVNPPAPPALSVTPASLSFTAVEGAASPASQSLTVSNTGGGTLTFTTSDDSSWLQPRPRAAAPATLTVAVTTLGLTRGTYTGSVRMTAAGAAGLRPTSGDAHGVAAVDRPRRRLGLQRGQRRRGHGRVGHGQQRHGLRRDPRRRARRQRLSFDGINDSVTVPDADSLDLTNRMTLEAWVRPATHQRWRTVLLKEQTGQLVYSLYASTDNGRPTGHVFTTGD